MWRKFLAFAILIEALLISGGWHGGGCSSCSTVQVTVPGIQTITTGTATSISGIVLAANGNVTSPYTMTLVDTNGVLTATGTGVSGSGTTSLTIASSLSNITAALATLQASEATPGTDTIVINASDSASHTAAAAQIVINSTGGVEIDDTNSSIIYSSPNSVVSIATKSLSKQGEKSDPILGSIERLAKSVQGLWNALWRVHGERGSSWVAQSGVRGDYNNTEHNNNYCATNPPQTTPVLGPMAVFNFTGTSVVWIGKKGPNIGIAAVAIDGGTPTTIDNYNATTLFQQQLASFTGLANGSHTMSIQATCTKNASSTDFYQVVDAFIINGSGAAALAFSSGTQGVWSNSTFNTSLTSCGSSCSGNPDWALLATGSNTNLNSTGQHVWSGAASNTMTWTFTGSLIELFTRPDTGGGYYTITIDGGTPTASILDYYNPVDNDAMTGYMSYAAKLGSGGSHSIVLTTTGVNNPFGGHEGGGQTALVQVDMFLAFP